MLWFWQHFSAFGNCTLLSVCVWSSSHQGVCGMCVCVHFYTPLCPNMHRYIASSQSPDKPMGLCLLVCDAVHVCAFIVIRFPPEQTHQKCLQIIGQPHYSGLHAYVHRCSSCVWLMIDNGWLTGDECISVTLTPPLHMHIPITSSTLLTHTHHTAASIPLSAFRRPFRPNTLTLWLDCDTLLYKSLHFSAVWLPTWCRVTWTSGRPDTLCAEEEGAQGMHHPFLL